jgi:acyl-coenzyme A thioesterase PaaI-like protein
MKKMAFSILDKLMRTSDKKSSLIALNQVFKVSIPFNAPHGFSIEEISQEKIKISIPNRKLNHNHLGGIHACAMATLGEFCAGLWLSKNLGLSKYRLILAELNVKYHYQGRTDLMGECNAKDLELSTIESALETEGKTIIPLITEIHDKNSMHVATVTSTWQVKSWDKVQTRGV